MQCSQALTQLQLPPPPYYLCNTLFFSISLLRFWAVFSHSLTRALVSHLCAQLYTCLSLVPSLYLCAPSCCILHYIQYSIFCLILKLHSSFYAFTISQCLYVGPDSAYITLDTMNSSLCWILFCRLGRQFYQL